MLNAKYYSASPDCTLEEDLSEMYFLFFILVYLIARSYENVTPTSLLERQNTQGFL